MDVFTSDCKWESFSDSSGSEDTEELSFSYGGQACSILSSLEEAIGKIDDFLSFERGFIHGDIVCSAADPSGQMGRVVNVKMFVDLENVHGRIIKDVDSKKLLKIQSISAGDFVVHGPWIGKVDKVVDSVTILFDDGTKSEISAMDQEKLVPVSPNLLDDSMYLYYPGQRVQVRHSTASKSARWLCGAWRESRDTGTVCAVKAGLVYVDWLACALLGCDSSLPAPPRLQDGKNLTLLSCLLHENWQLGDRCILPVADYKNVKEQIIFSTPTIELFRKHKTVGNGFNKEDLHSNFQDIFVIVKTKTIVDVLWQDGGCTLGLDSQTLLPINVVNVHEFWPGQYVVEKGTCDDSHVSGNQKWGVVISVDAKERTVQVKWKSTGVDQADIVAGNQTEGETVSAYELVEHPDYAYCFGDIVVKNVDEVDKFQINRETDMGEDVTIKGEDNDRDKIDYCSKGYLSYIGYITGFEGGAVEVTWASGLKSKVPPNEIVRIDKYEGSATASVLLEQNLEELDQELVDHDTELSALKGKDLLSSNGIDEECKKYQMESNSLHQCTIGFFTRIVRSIFGSFGSTSLSGAISSTTVSEYGSQPEKPVEEEIEETCDMCTEMQPLVAAEMQRFEKTSLKQEVDDIQENKELQSSSTSNGPEQFRHFDMVGDASDHRFDGAGKKSKFSQVKRARLKKVQQEWSTLEKDLPESIYVRIYEERMDLLRAVIVGAPGTPYHDGLFFFDIYLPPEYPYEPPLVHYHSCGLRVNPNLYESGKVCLSLLNTWTGTDTEVWNPESSSILQVLLSIQALVLNEKPYFNEAGYDRQIGRAEGEKNSVSYNESAFLSTWKSMLYLLRHPPKHFEALVEEHLKGHSQNILLACKAYMEGTPVACAFSCGKTEYENQKGSSTGFKIILAKLFPKLVEAFSAKGIDCSQFAEVEK